MDSHNGTDVASKISPASSDSEVFRWIEAVSVYHKIAVIFIDRWCLASVSAVEEFWKASLLSIVDDMHIEPSAIAR